MTRKFEKVPAAPVDAYQNLGEFGALWELVAAGPHARVLEIGSLFGGTLWYWSHLPNIDTLVTIDLPSDRPEFATDVRAARELWPSWMADIEFVDMQADSHNSATIDEVSKFGPFDFVFVDGDHSYEGVRGDWMAWCDHIRPGGLVAFHDTWQNGERHEPGVVRWVDEFRHHLPSIEWTDPDGVGICAFRLPA